MKKLIAMVKTHCKSTEQISSEANDILEQKDVIGSNEVFGYWKWLKVPIGILLTLWIFKSIMLALVVGFGVAAFLDRQSIQVKGLNRLAMLSLLYVIGFSVFIIVLLKVTSPLAPNGILYSFGENEIFFDKYTYVYLLRDNLLRGL